MHVDQISNRTGIDFPDLAGVLLKLELKGLVEAHAGGRYRLKTR